MKKGGLKKIEEVLKYIVVMMIVVCFVALYGLIIFLANEY